LRPDFVYAMLGAMINTTQVAGRRQLHFNSLEDIHADVEALARAKEIRPLGNWSPGQVINHLTIVLNKSIDGFDNRPPAVVRFVLRLVFKRRFLTKSMSPGFKLPGGAQVELWGPEIGLAEAVDRFRSAYQRLKSETKRAPHPAIGVLTASEWEQLHCRHSELHLSFLVPVEGGV
jgi:hypothetical protein